MKSLLVLAVIISGLALADEKKLIDGDPAIAMGKSLGAFLDSKDVSTFQGKVKSEVKDEQVLTTIEADKQRTHVITCRLRGEGKDRNAVVVKSEPELAAPPKRPEPEGVVFEFEARYKPVTVGEALKIFLKEKKKTEFEGKITHRARGHNLLVRFDWNEPGKETAKLEARSHEVDCHMHGANPHCEKH